jgi:hypothetical protein
MESLDSSSVHVAVHLVFCKSPRRRCGEVCFATRAIPGGPALKLGDCHFRSGSRLRLVVLLGTRASHRLCGQIAIHDVEGTQQRHTKRTGGERGLPVHSTLSGDFVRCFSTTCLTFVSTSLYMANPISGRQTFDKMTCVLPVRLRIEHEEYIE